MSKRVVAIIQAHMSSSRLPGKIMKDLCGQPELFRMLERVRHSVLLDDIVVATSTLPCDDLIVQKCAEWGVHTFRGSDSDVLSRYYGAAQMYPADVYVRMTSDCPLLDPRYVDATIGYFLKNDFRYVSNANDQVPATFPLGMGCEVFTAELLEEDFRNATEGYEHEHVTPYMYWKQSSLGAYSYRENVSNYRITLDTPEDYEVISRIYNALYQPGNYFTLEQIIEYLRANPEVAQINRMIVQKKARD